MKWFVTLLSLLPLVASASCNHYMVDHNKKLACVTITNGSKQSLTITSLNGIFTLHPGVTVEAMLIPGHLGKVKLVPYPPIPKYNRALNCAFPVPEARKNPIVITYYGNDSSVVVPSTYSQNCHF